MFKLAVCESITSTQLKLIEAVRNGLLEDSFALVSFSQTNGIGTHNREWYGSDDNLLCNMPSNITIDYFNDLNFVFFDDYINYNIDVNSNLYMSFYTKDIPNDLPIQSISIYYSTILKLILKENDSKAFVKWPNDIYLGTKKIGGVICSKIKDKVICGIGLNILSAPNEAGVLDIDLDLKSLLKAFFVKIEKILSWKDIFECYKNDFELSRLLSFKDNGKVYSLSEANLYSDGSILVNDRRIYSLR